MRLEPEHTEEPQPTYSRVVSRASDLPESDEPDSGISDVWASVVIPTRGIPETLDQQLSALARQESGGRRWEVILVITEGGKRAATYADEAPRSSDAEVRLLTEERPGLNVARNSGIRAARADRILLCDADDLVQPGWLAGLADALSDAELTYGMFDVVSLNSVGARVARGYGTADALVPGKGGGNIAFRRGLWADLGGFDESYGIGGDDTEFLWRAEIAGARFLNVRSAVLSYRLRGDRGELFRQYRRYGRSRVLLERQFAGSPVASRQRVGQWRRWLWLIRNAPHSRSQDEGLAGQWMKTAGEAVGRIEGRIELWRFGEIRSK